MTQVEDIVIKLLRTSLTGKRVDIPADVPWGDVMQVAEQQGVLGVCFDALEAFKKPVSDGFTSTGSAQAPVSEASGGFPDMDTLMDWLGQTSYLEEMNQHNWQMASELADIWKGQGIKTIVLKGFSLCQFYPKPLHRFSGDLDVYLCDDVYKTAYESGNLTAEGLGIKVDREQYKHSKFDYKGLTIENHQFCISIRGDKQAKRLEACLEDLLAREQLSSIKGASLFCPSPLFNALFVTVHNQNHFLHEKITLRHLCDWIVLRSACNDQIDWNRYKVLVSKFGLEKFAESMNALADYVEGALSFDNLSDRDLCLLNDIFTSEIEGNFDTSLSSRIRGLKNIWASRWKYSMFTNKSAYRHLITVIVGFLFDRKPSIK